jgi:type VI secretion system protein ImpM
LSAHPPPAPTPAGEAAGWYGKLPSLGDFASRRLAQQFIDAWDDWLNDGLAGWRTREPQSWLDAYLAGSSWRFVLMPGVMPEKAPDPRQAWAGVLMPSVDKVGRYFPLTLAQPLVHVPATSAQAEPVLGWLQQLDDLAVDALHDDWDVDRLEAELHRLGPCPEAPALPDEPGDACTAEAFDRPLLQLRPSGGLAVWLADIAGQRLLAALHGRALWLRTDDQGRPVLRISRGLPLADDFSALLSGLDSATASSVR